MTVSRDGRPVALLVPLGRQPLSVDVLIERWSHLPAMEPELLRRDIDGSDLRSIPHPDQMSGA